jgi:formamidopyrimidine-DNA glycosylase
MPELPEVEAVRRRIAPAMQDAAFVRVDLRRPDLRRAFPVDFVARLTGAVVRDVGRRAKYLLLALSTGETLVMHLGMSGDFRVEPAGDGRPGLHDHVVFLMSSDWVVTFRDPRRFGVMDLLTAAEVAADATLGGLGPEPLSEHFDAASLARACAGRTAPLKATLLDQRVVAGLGNIYAVEALHLAGLSPRRRASTLATPTGKPRPAAVRLAAAIKEVIAAAVARQVAGDYRAAPFAVYERAGEPCPTVGCPGTIRRIVQAGRSTYYCPICQR